MSKEQPEIFEDELEENRFDRLDDMGTDVAEIKPDEGHVPELSGTDDDDMEEGYPASDDDDESEASEVNEDGDEYGEEENDEDDYDDDDSGDEEGEETDDEGDVNHMMEDPEDGEDDNEDDNAHDMDDEGAGPEDVFNGSSHPGPGETPARRSGKRKGRTGYVIAGVIGVAILIILTPFISNWYAQGQLDEADIDVESMKLVSSDRNSLTLSVGLNVRTPSGMDARFHAMELDMFYGDDLLGDTAITSGKLKEGRTEVEAAFHCRNDEVLDAFLADFYSMDELNVRLVGTVGVTTGGFLSAVSLKLDLDKELLLPGMGDLMVDVTSLSLRGTGSSSCIFNATVRVGSPSPLSVELGDISLSLHTSYGALGTAVGRGVKLSRGNNTFHATFDMDDADERVLAMIASDYLSSRSMPITVAGSCDTSLPGMLGYALSRFETTVDLGGDGVDRGLEVNMTELSLDIDDEGITCTYGAEVHNPTPVSGEIDGLVLDIRKGTRASAGTIDLSPFHVSPGSNLVSGEGVVTIHDADYLSELTTAYLNGEPLELSLSGRAPSGGISAVLSSANISVETRSTTPLAISVREVSLISADEDEFVFLLRLGILGPEGLRARIDSLRVSVGSQGRPLGNATLGPLAIDTSVPSADVEVSLNVSDGALLREVVGNFLSGRDTMLTVAIGGKVDVNASDSLVQCALAELAMNVTLPGGTDVKVSLAELKLVNITDTSVVFYADVTVNSPVDVEGELTGLNLTVRYGNKVLGWIEPGPLHIRKGSNSFALRSAMITAQGEAGDPLKELVTAFFEGTSPVLLVSPSADGALGDVLESLSFSFPLDAAGKFACDITELAIKASSLDTDTLALDVTVSIINPAPFVLAIPELRLDAECVYGDLGRFTLNDVDLSPGLNLLPLNVSLAPARSVLLPLLEDYLTGNEVNMTATLNATGLAGGWARVLGDLETVITLDPVPDFGIDVRDISILASGENSITISSGLNIFNPFDIVGEVPDFTVSLGTSFGELGVLSVEQMKLSRGWNNLTLTPPPFRPDAAVLGEVVGAYMEGRDTVFYIGPVRDDQGTVLAGVLSSSGLTVTMDSPGAVETRDFNFTLVSLDSEGLLGLNVSVLVNNPGVFNVTLEELTALLSYEDSEFAEVALGELEVPPGSFRINRSITLDPMDMDAMSVLAGNYLSGINSSISVNLEAEYGAPCISRAVAERIEMNLSISGLTEGVFIDLGNMTVKGTSNDGFLMDVEAEITNPTEVRGPIPGLVFDVEYEGGIIGSLDTPGMTLATGTRTEFMEIEAAIDHALDVESIVTLLLDGSEVELTLKGSAENGDNLSYMLSEYSIPVILESNGSLEVGMEDVRLISADAENAIFELEMNLSVHNPTTFAVNMDEASIELKYGQGVLREFLGTLETANVNVFPGDSLLAVRGNLTPRNRTLVRDLITDHLKGENVTLNASVSINFSAEGGGASELTLTSDIVIPGCRELRIEVDSVELVESRNDSMTLRVHVRLFNPTFVHGTVPSIPLDVEYNGSVIGNLETGEMSLDMGWNSFLLNLSVQGMDANERDRFVGDFLKGGELNVTVRPSDDSEMGYMLSGIEFNVTIGTGVAINITIGNITLTGTTENSLSFRVDVGINNPSSMEIGMNDTLLDVFYKEQDIGNLTIDNQTILPGGNVISTDLVLGSSNDTLLEEVIAAYVAGDSTTFRVEGTYNVTSPGASSPANWSLALDVVFPGVEESIITGISIDSIVPNINVQMVGFPPAPQPVVSYTITLTAHLRNPTSIGFNLTRMVYDVYFDDADGAALVFMGQNILNYNARNNIKLTTIDESPDPAVSFDASEEKGYQAVYVGNDIETGVRLDDEYKQDQLDLDLLNGEMTLEMGAFTIDVPFEFRNVHVNYP